MSRFVTRQFKNIEVKHMVISIHTTLQQNAQGCWSALEKEESRIDDRSEEEERKTTYSIVYAINAKALLIDSPSDCAQRPGKGEIKVLHNIGIGDRKRKALL